jgi:UDP-glucuronate decarboxylase
MKHIVITGGAGFIGRNLCSKLIDNNYIYCIDNLITGSMENIREFMSHPNFTFIEHDICNVIQLKNVDEIYHLGCIASPDKYKEFSIETLRTCFIGTLNILELAKQHGSKFLFTSTSEVYGDPHVHPQPEEYYGNVNTVGERSCYDEGKRVAETLIYEYNKKYGLDTKIVRLFNTYGPYMSIDDGRVITNFIKQIKKGEFLQIYGDGKQTRSFCYIDDLLEGLISMMNSIQKGPINLGNPHCEFTLNELVQEFEKITDKNLYTKYLPGTENDPKQRKPNIEKASQLLNFRPKVGLQEGLKKTIDFFIF